MRPGALRAGTPDTAVATLAAVSVGGGLVFALAGGASGQTSWLLLGAAGSALGLGLLVAGEWLSGTMLVALAVPLPALASGGGVRIAGAAPVAAVVLAGWAATFVLPGRRLDVGRFPTVAMLLLMIAWTASAIFSQSPLVAARETFNFFLLIALLIAAVDLLRRRPEGREEVVAVLAALAALCGVLAVLETAGVIPGAFPRPGTSLHRAALGFGQPNGLGLFLALAIPLVVHRRGTAGGWQRTVWGAALIATVAGLVGTFSRGAWLAVLAGAGALALVGHPRRALRIWLGAALLAGAADLVTGGAIRDTVERAAGDWVLEQRAALAVTGLVMYADHPLLGVGPGGFAERLDEYGALVTTLEDLQPTPHNAYVQAAAETGTLGLLAFFAVMVVVAVRLVRLGRESELSEEASLRRAVLWSMATVAASGMVIWPFAHGYGEAVVLILAVGLSAPKDPAAGEVGT